ncbi:hypothetical protein PoB_005968900 [Plakobranchus ocellatus]|uniref:Uncharacterized protein n=1 Tax=Plakobranchus ocellatus TaxID=259542 RepID=A0AAV4CK09_9GAST|nr:hypothetical protein PoB_005968900 [Plakobranchus ocellatus]
MSGQDDAGQSVDPQHDILFCSNRIGQCQDRMMLDRIMSGHDDVGQSVDPQHDILFCSNRIGQCQDRIMLEIQGYFHPSTKSGESDDKYLISVHEAPSLSVLGGADIGDQGLPLKPVLS